ncbi:INO80 complex subunit C [Scaptodrosophila lebanonensis]|uniref:INO80 complex subunit C n=1 Tax=Drosophila lebanonensis TaxID=7225 RepID=A0A6J2TVJ9_DROLE|nr:INO80 complex subunit C [Scaptodrosophila lebanonensis]
MDSLPKPRRSFKKPFAFPKNCTYRPLRQINNMERNLKLPADQPTYFTIKAPPSLLPAKKYSDISGLPAPYVDPHSKLRYSNSDEYASMQHMPSDIINGYLTLRGHTSAVG